VKLAGTAVIDARAVLIADSDAVLLREAKVDQSPTTAGCGSTARTAPSRRDMQRHVLWRDVTQRLLGVPGSP
jgi:hypothetical protein